MDFDNHDIHYECCYYPSNAFRIGSEQEFAFFKSKWTNQSDKRCVRRIYDDFRNRCGICPCRALLAFNVLDASVFADRNVGKLPAADGDDTITKFSFSNEYQLKSPFFVKRTDDTIGQWNRSWIECNMKDVIERCQFMESATTAATNYDKDKKYKRPVQNKRKLEKIEPILQSATAIADSLAKDVCYLKNIAAHIGGEKTTLSLSNQQTLQCLFNVLRKRARTKFQKLDYFVRHKCILSNLDMYMPRLSKNKEFKRKREIVLEQMRTDCLHFWGIDQQRTSIVPTRPETSQETASSLLGGQILPLNDNPAHPWYNMAPRCKHDGGVRIVHVQTRCNDEMISSIVYCNLCNRNI